MEEIAVLLDVKDKDINKQQESPTVPLEQSASSLFHCMEKSEWLCDIIKSKKLSPRYCIEKTDYLHIGIDEIAFPMICFCDIPLHKLKYHMSWYGKNAIAFSKDWGISHELQPILYVSESSEVAKVFTDAFNATKTFNKSADIEQYKIARDFLLTSLRYFKPLQGETKGQRRWFTDDCEWRYIAHFKDNIAPNVVIKKEQLSEIGMEYLNNAIANIPNVGDLLFEYSDIKYLIAETRSDFEKIVAVIDECLADNVKVKYELLSKILLWEEVKGDF